MNKLEYIPSQREFPMLLIDGYPFQRSKSALNKDGSISWRCKEYRNKIIQCKSTCNVLNETLIRPPAIHNHQPMTSHEIEFTKTNAVTKKRCREETGISCQKIFRQELGKVFRETNIELTVETASCAIPLKSCLNGLYRQRRKAIPKLPKLTGEIDLTGEYIVTNDHKQFLRYDNNNNLNRTIAFASETQLNCLELSEIWHVDGTFKTSPQLFFQLYIIYGWYEKAMHPCIFVFLQGKSTEVYIEMLEAIKKLGKFSPRIILGDFESAVIKAFAQVFSNSVYKGCYFHFCQALWRNIQQKGLIECYKNDRQIFRWLQLFKALAFLPIKMFENGYQIILQEMPSNQKIILKDFVSYFEKTWVYGLFKPSMWNHFDSTSPRTNNHVEGFNSGLKKFVDNLNPNIFSLIKSLKDLETEISIKILNLKNGSNHIVKKQSYYVKKEEKIENIKRNLMHGSISIAYFMRYSSFFYSYETNLKKNEYEFENLKSVLFDDYQMMILNDQIKQYNSFLTLAKPQKPALKKKQKLGLLQGLKLHGTSCWLTDEHIEAALQIMREQFSNVSGLLDPVTLRFREFCPVAGSTILILFTSSHWVTVTNINLSNVQAQSSTWFIYDSLDGQQYFTESLEILQRIQPGCSLLRTGSQRQEGLNDCGLFAIANAISLAFSINPMQLIFDQSKMRGYFDKCLASGKMSMYPLLI